MTRTSGVLAFLFALFLVGFTIPAHAGGDTTPPEISCPLDVTLVCEQSTDPLDTGSATATDDSGVVSTNYSDETSSGSCPVVSVIHRTWTATDPALNSSTCTQTLTVADTAPPDLAGVPSDLTVQCGEPLPDPAVVTATDACSGSVPVSFSETNAVFSTPPNFAQSYPVDGVFSSVQQVVTGDVDGDGDEDVVGAAPSIDQVAWFENQGSTQFIHHAIDSALDGAVYVFVKDVDGDLDTDVVASGNLADDIVWYENDGNESFTKRFVDSSLDDAQGVWVEDLDDDGDEDILAASRTPQDIVWYENNGSESFTKRLIDGSLNRGDQIQAVDMDGDLDLDVVVSADIGNTLKWYRNNGSEQFTTNVIGSVSAASGVQAVDMDGDLDVDVLTSAKFGNEVVWFENDGNESFTKRVVDATPSPRQSRAADMDCDGDLDVVVTADGGPGSNHDVLWYENNGLESFTKHIIDKNSLSGILVPFFFALGDLDGNGQPDLVVPIKGSNFIKWYPNDGSCGGCQDTYTRTWTATDACGNSASASQTITVADTIAPNLIGVPPDITVDCGQVPDPAQVTGSDSCGNPVSVLFSQTGAGAGFSPPTFAQSFPVDGAFTDVNQVVTGDVDSDGDEDVAGAAPAIDQVAWFENQGSTQFVQHAIDSALDGAAYVFVADVDGDLDTDVVASGSLADDVVWYENDGNESFTPHVVDPSLDEALGVWVEDLDGDGDQDILAAGRTSKDIVWYENNGSESFTKHLIDGNLNRGDQIQAVDMDGDQDLDVVVSADTGNTLKWYRNNGSEQFTTNVIGSVSAASGVQAVDLDGDQDVDVLTSAKFGNEVVWFENDGNESFTKKVVDATPSPRQSRAVDLDCDGDLDVAVTADGGPGSNHDVLWYENNGQQSFTKHIVDNNSLSGILNPFFFALGDLDGNGRLDLVVPMKGSQAIKWYPNDANCGGCQGTYTRTWKAIDACGNSASASQTITVVDAALPAITCPAGVTVQCGASTAPTYTGSATATDDCDVWPTLVYADDTAPGLCPPETIITRTWTATDDCGNSSQCLQIITVADTAAPAIFCPSNKTVSCGASTAPADTGLATATDNCDGSPTVNFSDSVQAGSCPSESTITRTWMATDLCGNSSQCAQTINVVDNTPPEFSGVPGTVTVQCGQPPPEPEDVTASDACTGSAPVTFSETNTVGTSVPPTFNQSYPVDGVFSSAQQVVTGDVDGDGDEDVVGAAPSIDRVAWFENQGSTQFVQHVIDNALDAAIYVFVKDVDGDLDTDVVASGNLADDIVWYENDGNESFTKRFVDSSLDDAQGVWVEDLDEDGDQDILAASRTPQDIVWYENNGSESFTKRLIDGSFNRGDQIQALDMDGDLDLDVVVSADTGNTLKWYRNNGSEQFTTNVIGSVDAASGVQAVDIDGDLDVDVLTSAKFGNEVAWFENDGNESFAKRVVDATPSPRQSRAVDLDCDGDMDVVVTADGGPGSNHDVLWYENNGLESFAKHTIDKNSLSGILVPFFFALGDLDGNGRPDLVVPIKGSNFIKWYPNDGNCDGCQGTITRTWTATDACGNSASVSQLIHIEPGMMLEITCPANVTIDCSASTDPNQTGSATATGPCEGSPDITFSDSVAPGTCPQSYVITRSWTAADECGSSTQCSQILTVVDSAPPQLTVPANMTIDCGDDNSPAKTGIANATDDCDPSPGVSYHDLFSSGCSVPLAFARQEIDPALNGVHFVTSADVDGDNDMDLVAAAHESDRVIWYENLGLGNSFTGHVVDAALDGAVYVAPADVDGDGDTDIAATGRLADDVVWYENDGAQNFSKHVVDPFLDEAMGIAVADIDGDGARDILAAGRIAQDIVWYQNDGLENFTKRTIDANHFRGDQVQAVDLDGDLDVDVVVSSDIGNNLRWYENDGAENFTLRNIGSVNASSGVQAVDMDGDTDIDVLTAAKFGDEVAWFENNGAEAFTKRMVDATPSPRQARAADLDGDGDMDVVVTADGGPGSDHDVLWYENNGSESFTLHIVDNNGLSGIINPYCFDGIADIDGNGCLDFVIPMLGSDQVILYKRTGNYSDQTTITRVWTATDACGHSQSTVQTVTVVDVTPPVLGGLPDDITVQCDPVPPPPEVTAIDDCDEQVDVNFFEAVEGNCPGLITRTWWATDLSGNVVSNSRLVTLVIDPVTDSDADTLPDAWETENNLPPFMQDALADPDHDGFSNYAEYIADTDPHDASSFFNPDYFTKHSPINIYFPSAADRVYTLEYNLDLEHDAWAPVPGQANVPGTGDLMSLFDAREFESCSYRITVELP